MYAENALQPLIFKPLIINIMPTEITMYCCDYCDEMFDNKDQAILHEKNCKLNIEEDELESSDN
jgi:hypothetical protein